MPRAGPQRALLLTLLVLLVSVPPTALGQETGDRLVSESLWGVKQDVGLTFVRQLVTNVADRPFWASRPDGEAVRIAVIDTGLDPDHPDLQDALACSHCWRDLVDGRPSPYDDHGHGTHVAGILAGRGHLQLNPLSSYFPTGARGMAPASQLIVAKAMNQSGAGQDATVAEAITWSLDPDGDPSTDDGAHIVHLSLGIQSPSGRPSGVPALDSASKTEQAVREAVEQGVFVVMSAGNQGESGPASPGGVEGVLAVGALDSQNRILSFSNTGQGVDVYAPGVITSSWPAQLDKDGIDDGYTGLAGTSQAAPVVTGALALVLDANPALKEGGGLTKVSHLESRVRSTGQPVQGAPGQAVALDANALLASQDQGASGVAWGVVIALLVVALVALFVTARLILGLLERHAERHNEKQEGDAIQPPPPPPEAGPGAGENGEGPGQNGGRPGGGSAGAPGGSQGDERG